MAAPAVESGPISATGRAYAAHVPAARRRPPGAFALNFRRQQSILLVRKMSIPTQNRKGCMNRRQYPRKALDPMHVAAIMVGERPTLLASAGTLLNASATGLLIRVSCRALNPALVESNGTLVVPQDTLMRMHIVEMALDIDGEMVRMDQTGPEWWDIAMDFTASAPAYWRECLADLLPSVGEMTPGAAPASGEASATCHCPMAFGAGSGEGGGCKGSDPITTSA